MTSHTFKFKDKAGEREYLIRFNQDKPGSPAIHIEVDKIDRERGLHRRVIQIDDNEWIFKDDKPNTLFKFFIIPTASSTSAFFVHVSELDSKTISQEYLH